MSTAPFPQLLRRSTFAAHDPYISRVYTSTPSSIYQYGDFGLKYPIQRAKGPRYIKFSSLDAGKPIGADWRSAEQEARFVQAWGTGRFAWRGENDLPRYETRSFRNDTEMYAKELDEGGGDKQVSLMDDVNSMSPRAFRNYLKRIRSKRQDFLNERLNRLGQSAKDKLVLPEDKTLVTLETRGKLANPDTSALQVSLAREELEKPNSKLLHSAPHRVHGLSYSHPSLSSTSLDPMLRLPGRAIDKVSHLTGTMERARNFRPSEGTNRPWVVALGSVGAKTQTTMDRISDAPVIDQGIDFTREDEHRGEAQWRVTSAKLNDPPRVLGLDELTEASRSVRRGRPTSAAKKISPLDTFKFDITVQHASASPDAADEPRPEIELGSRAWVGREPVIQRPSSFSDDLGLGGPKNLRRPGEGFRQLRDWEQRAEKETMEVGAATVSKLLARLNKQGS